MPVNYTEIIVPTNDELSVLQIGALVWNEAHKSNPPRPVLVRFEPPHVVNKEKKR